MPTHPSKESRKPVPGYVTSTNEPVQSGPLVLRISLRHELLQLNFQRTKRPCRPVQDLHPLTWPAQNLRESRSMMMVLNKGCLSAGSRRSDRQYSYANLAERRYKNLANSLPCTGRWILRSHDLAELLERPSQSQTSGRVLRWSRRVETF
jgi:hypothetical protein